jgi:hypothetical protein
MILEKKRQFIIRQGKEGEMVKKVRGDNFQGRQFRY